MNAQPLVPYRADEPPPTPIPDGLALWVLSSAYDHMDPAGTAYLGWEEGRIYWDSDVWRLRWDTPKIRRNVLGWMLVPVSMTRDDAEKHPKVWDRK